MRFEPTDMYEEPRYKVRWLVTMPPIDPPIARDCMATSMTMPTRLAHQVTGHSVIRDCCWHHGVDWHQMSAMAVTLARRLRREHITDEDDRLTRANDLTCALSEDQRGAVLSLLSPDDGITVHHEAGDRRRLSYQNGRKRTHAMLEAGVRRTVVVRWVDVRPR